ncbi:M42 family metallopeptidase [Ureaplasma urealyticum]|uniref:M42 family metallopeptidase n=3 Tax=Ureaplasma urealyticum TaxID=2130 RepID=A0AAP9A9Y9_UREUR|nr:M42 family metallopeptidase [Ureaplasma urealyticum]EDX53992.1 endo-1,4-beta-glucanase [Ureaplasma urealyticum serovar 9 str. ATCC 33175]ACI59922.1 endo-1,4-beta-glucanase [Ureaplasma urealyticum serovar 10 str. ATCC 33699]EDT49502.1 endo-1,4-beta-glucanase [Ureaplasma urealyticum serovar 13 str. ATCC 33698]EDU06086.1 endo-1,4-beta-glucanase [Ureaplasma urealyticum serovar 5 str. ATCC 27817]EDU56977.1 endo-1,4-beta-glucanase [Ureaplasma urealyticum serovar 7 str. ATCC 27819]
MSKFSEKEIRQKAIEYMEIYGMSRHEERVATKLKTSLKDVGVSYERDNLGSIIFKKTNSNKGPKILIATHMDEVGFVVQQILDNGQLLLSMVGGVWPNIVIGSVAKVYVDEQRQYTGVFGHTSIHILEPEARSKAVPVKELFVDCGFSSKQQALDLGVEIGTEVYMEGPSLNFHDENYIVGKAVDNRVSVAVLDLLVHSLKDKVIPNQTYFAATVQEEVGLRGAKTVVSKVKPDIGIVIDTTTSHDTYKCPEGDTKLNDGVCIRMKDGGTLVNPALVKYFEALAKKHNIPLYKYVARGGGTDAEELQYGPDGGVLTIGLSIPQRYLHAPIGVATVKDMKAAFDLVREFLEVFDENEFEKVKFK